jgi:hypothetical protein
MKSGNADIPILIEAKQEYENVKAELTMDLFLNGSFAVNAKNTPPRWVEGR